MTEWSDLKKWIFGLLASTTVILISVFINKLASNEHVMLGEKDLMDEYYLELFQGNRDSCEIVYNNAVKLSQLSFKYDTIDSLKIMRSSFINIGYDEDQVLIARSNKSDKPFIVAIDLLEGQGNKHELKEEAENLLIKMRNRFTNIENDFVGNENAGFELTLLAKEMCRYFEVATIKYYSSTDYRNTYKAETE